MLSALLAWLILPPTRAVLCPGGGAAQVPPRTSRSDAAWIK
jgi:hypothetical protein